jgi:hypothetical protein
LGAATGGSRSRLAELRIRWVPLAVVGLALQLLTPSGRTLPLLSLVLSFVLLIAFALENVRLGVAGFRLILVGVLLNFTVVAVNGGMPVSRSALEASGQLDTLQALVEDGGAKHHLAGDGDVLVFLGDVIPVPPIHNVVSLGDIATYVGAAWLVVAAMHGRRRSSAPAPAVRGAGVA